MRRLNFARSGKTASGWNDAVRLTASYLEGKRKADDLLGRLPDFVLGERRARCQSLFLGALRHGFRVRAAARPFLRKPPAAGLEAVLLVAGFELIEGDASTRPKIVHHAVEQSKSLLRPAESAFLNALLRKLPAALDAQTPETGPAAFFSHPQWLVEHWTAAFGEDDARRLLEWNQRLPVNYLRIYGGEAPPPGAEPGEWPGFYRLRSGGLQSEACRALLAEGRAYVKDPSTRHAPALLAPAEGESVLDLCAAPGGKAFDLAQAMRGRGRLVAVDLPGRRIERLRANLAKLRTSDFEAPVVERDVLELDAGTFRDRDLPDRYDAVMLDAPCSNTGVIQRRVDVKWRLRPDDIAACAKLQQQLIHSAARFVRPGGRLVYSTCSIEAEENAVLVQDFLASKSGRAFSLENSVRCLPWECGHDGATAFLLKQGIS